MFFTHLVFREGSTSLYSRTTSAPWPASPISSFKRSSTVTILSISSRLKSLKRLLSFSLEGEHEDEEEEELLAAWPVESFIRFYTDILVDDGWEFKELRLV